MFDNVLNAFLECLFYWPWTYFCLAAETYFGPCDVSTSETFCENIERNFTKKTLQQSCFLVNFQNFSEQLLAKHLCVSAILLKMKLTKFLTGHFSKFSAVIFRKTLNMVDLNVG